MGTTESQRAERSEHVANKGLIAYFAGNPVAANLLMLVGIVGGLASGLQLAVQNYPDIDL